MKNRFKRSSILPRPDYNPPASYGTVSLNDTPQTSSAYNTAAAIGSTQTSAPSPRMQSMQPAAAVDNSWGPDGPPMNFQDRYNAYMKREQEAKLQTAFQPGGGGWKEYLNTLTQLDPERGLKVATAYTKLQTDIVGQNKDILDLTHKQQEEALKKYQLLGTAAHALSQAGDKAPQLLERMTPELSKVFNEDQLKMLTSPQGREAAIGLSMSTQDPKDTASIALTQAQTRQAEEAVKTQQLTQMKSAQEIQDLQEKARIAAAQRQGIDPDTGQPAAVPYGYRYKNPQDKSAGLENIASDDLTREKLRQEAYQSLQNGMKLYFNPDGTINEKVRSGLAGHFDFSKYIGGWVPIKTEGLNQEARQFAEDMNTTARNYAILLGHARGLSGSAADSIQADLMPPYFDNGQTALQRFTSTERFLAPRDDKGQIAPLLSAEIAQKQAQLPADKRIDPIQQFNEQTQLQPAIVQQAMDAAKKTLGQPIVGFQKQPDVVPTPAASPMQQVAPKPQPTVQAPVQSPAVTPPQSAAPEMSPQQQADMNQSYYQNAVDNPDQANQIKAQLLQGYNPPPMQIAPAIQQAQQPAVQATAQPQPTPQQQSVLPAPVDNQAQVDAANAAVIEQARQVAEQIRQHQEARAAEEEKRRQAMLMQQQAQQQMSVLPRPLLDNGY